MEGLDSKETLFASIIALGSSIFGVRKGGQTGKVNLCVMSEDAAKVIAD